MSENKLHIFPYVHTLLKYPTLPNPDSQYFSPFYQCSEHQYMSVQKVHTIGKDAWCPCEVQDTIDPKAVQVR